MRPVRSQQETAHSAARGGSRPGRLPALAGVSAFDFPLFRSWELAAWALLPEDVGRKPQVPLSALAHLWLFRHHLVSGGIGMGGRTDPRRPRPRLC